MTESDSEARFDEAERDNLQRAMAMVETALAVSTAGTRAILEKCLRNVRDRVEALNKKIKTTESEQKTRDAEAIAMTAYRAEEENALNKSEREEYRGFLQKECFTKRDFASLESFYTHTYDRLSESGKNSMSHRIWEGVRREEYKFGELPDTVKNREAERVYGQISKGTSATSDLENIPSKDKSDFASAYEAGSKDQAYRILERQSFSHNIATKGHDSTSPRGKLEQAKSDAKATAPTKNGPSTDSLGDLDAGALAFKEPTKPAQEADVTSGLPPAVPRGRNR